ncbi:MAG: UbiA family prenyltransferase [Ignavibacteria bacterium]|jgi:4-hydroxybenzoate polyprenyltransferase
MQSSSSFIRIVIKQIRVYQWVKNLLIFVPLMLAHKTNDAHAIMQCILGFAAMSFLASSVYVLNDLADVEHDRAHPRKRFRPLASGAISIPQAWITVAVLLTATAGLSFLYLPAGYVAWLGVYAVATTLYSFVLKRLVLVDVIALAGMYSLRIAAGGAAASVDVSPWLLGFTLFLFMSLAFLKRYTELRDTIERDGHIVSGRGYHVGDSSFVMMAGTALGFVAVLIFTLYVNGTQVQALYAHPNRMWLIAPCLVYWISHLWLTAHRGGMHDDPIVFAARDARSWIVGALIVVIAVAST